MDNITFSFKIEILDICHNNPIPFCINLRSKSHSQVLQTVNIAIIYINSILKIFINTSLHLNILIDIFISHVISQEITRERKTEEHCKI